MKLQDAIDWAHRAEPAEIFISSHPRKTQNALWLLVAEIDRLTALLAGELESYQLSDRIATARMKTAEAKAVELLETVKLAYRKHHMDDSAIGWDELDGKLLDALCNTMGDGNFNKWLESV